MHIKKFAKLGTNLAIVRAVPDVVQIPLYNLQYSAVLWFAEYVIMGQFLLSGRGEGLDNSI